MAPSLAQWQARLDQVAEKLLEQCQGPVAPGMFHLEVSPCSQHGSGCVSLIYGAVLRHVPWKETDPEQLTRELLPDPVLLSHHLTRFEWGAQTNGPRTEGRAPTSVSIPPRQN